MGAASIQFGGYNIVPDPASTEEISGINGLPPLNAAVEGYQLFDIDNATGTTIGTFDADGSVFQALDFGNGFESVYSDLASASGNVISDTLVTPFGDFPMVPLFDIAGSLGAADFPMLP